MKSLIYLSCIFLCLSCKKADQWLDKKFERAQNVPSTVQDFQSLLDNDLIATSLPNYALEGTDDFYLLTANYLTQSEPQRNYYIWASDIFKGSENGEWPTTYKIVSYCNIALEGLKKINVDVSNLTAYNNVKGSALFFRARMFFIVAQLYAKPYAKENLQEPGIPLRLVSDINVKISRATIHDTYQQIITDLVQAIPLLPDKPLILTRPSKVSAYALLSKVYLIMQDYEAAERYSSEVLKLQNTLLDYNAFSSTSGSAFPSFSAGGNSEILLYGTSSGLSMIRGNGNFCFVDSLLYSTYSNDDLRKTLYFRTISVPLKQYTFRGSYAGGIGLFTGLAVNEIYLNRAESRVRQGKISAAIDDINTLLVKRWKTGKFAPITVNDRETLLNIILQERRKELLFTGWVRWEDLRRLNLEPARAKMLTRRVNSQVYELPPNDLRYVILLPTNEVLINRLEQNKR